MKVMRLLLRQPFVTPNVNEVELHVVVKIERIATFWALQSFYVVISHEENLEIVQRFIRKYLNQCTQIVIIHV